MIIGLVILRGLGSRRSVGFVYQLFVGLSRQFHPPLAHPGEVSSLITFRRPVEVDSRTLN